MKPVYLEMNYFGPHEHSIIDFRRLEEAPIFLIGGDTGAGKSTIFDAMTFALFGSTTSDRDAREMRSQFAPDNKKTSVIFYFEQGNNLYKIERTPEQMLEKKTKTKGLTKRTTTATLGIVEKVGGNEIQSIANKPTDVGNEIGGILKLSAEQFKKIILLPQNDFSEFLKAKTSDKESILEKIFGTQIFTEFTEKLKEKYGAAKDQSTDFENELKTQINSLNLTDEELEKLTHEAPDQKIKMIKNLVDTKKTNALNAQTEADTTNKNLTDHEKKLEAAKNLQNKFNHLNDLKKQYQTNIVDKSANITTKSKHVSELDWAEQFKDTVRDLKKIQQDNKDNLDTQKAINKKLISTKNQYDLATKKLDDLNQQQSTIDLKNKRIEILFNLIPSVQRSEKLKQNLSDLKPQIESIETDLKKQTEVQTTLTSQIETKQEKLINSGNLQDQKDKLLNEKESFVDTLSPLDNDKRNLTSDLTNSQKKQLKLKADVETKQINLETAKKVYQEKIGTRQSLMIAQLQQELVDGEPCVVCGSIEHPNVVHTVAANEKDLKQSIEDVDTSQKNYAAAEQDLKLAQTTLDKNESEISKIKNKLDSANTSLNTEYKKLVSESTIKNLPNDYNLQDIKECFDEQIKDVSKNIAITEKLTNEISELKDSLNSKEKSISKIKIQLTNAKSKQSTFENDLAELAKQVEKNDKESSELVAEQTSLKKEVSLFNEQLENSKNIVHTDRVALSSINTQLTDIDGQVKKNTDNIKTLQYKIDTALTNNGKTTDFDQLKDWISEINDGINSQLKDLISSYNKEKELLSTDITKTEKELNGLKIPDIKKLTEELNSQKELHNQAVTKAAQLKLTYDNTHATYLNIQKITNNQSNFGKKLAEITSLYNVITGKDGNDDKLKLETYVVQNYLREVLDFANQTYINVLSNNRYSFEIAEQGSNKRTDHGLDINVYDNETGATRSSDTLSGGETFIAALSIALSLSEVVQSSANGVKIDALFVDEGFGSLDDETLSKAMSALETIGENRMVGVISHIETMKAAIGQQVLIKKVGDGRSTVKIVNK